MNFRLVDSAWGGLFHHALRVDHERVRIICPFIKEQAAWRIVDEGRRPRWFQVITRFDLDCFAEGASDISALELLQSRGAQIRGVKNLHSKVYLFGSRAIVTSANLTQRALRTNHEFGFESTDPAVFNICDRYFDDLWARAGEDVTDSQLDEWSSIIQHALGTGSRARLKPKLGDKGVEVGFTTEQPDHQDWVSSAEQGFVKFFGEGKNRLERSFPIFDEVNRAGCHWACSYPKRPRQPRDGALMYMGRLVKAPNDILIFGRAIGVEHRDSRDVASEADLAERPWKVDWPYYVRVHDAEFIDGTLDDGISLNELMQELNSDAFGSTQRHARNGDQGNTNPRAAIMQQAHVELTLESLQWLNDRFEQRLRRFGRISRERLAGLDWPEID